MDGFTDRITQNINNRSRSSSCSSPVRNQVFFQEIYSFGGNTLVRSYSCSHVSDKDDCGLLYQAVQVQVSSCVRPQRNSLAQIKYCNNKAAKLKKDFHEATCTVKKRIEEPKKGKGFCNKMMRKGFLYLFLPLLCAYALFLFNTLINCKCDWDLEKARNKLKDSVFGQDDAITKINSLLTKLTNEKNIVTMVFTGGVGVGKTYTSSIITQNLPWTFEKLITYSSFMEADKEGVFGSNFGSCGCNLLIVDDLSVNSVDKAIKLIELLQEKKSDKLLIILIFHTHSEVEESLILQELKKGYVDFDHIPFKNLDEDVLKKCFIEEIGRQKVIISEEELNKLIHNQMEHINIIKGAAGCKGVAEKVSYYNKKLSGLKIN